MRRTFILLSPAGAIAPSPGRANPPHSPRWLVQEPKGREDATGRPHGQKAGAATRSTNREQASRTPDRRLLLPVAVSGGRRPGAAQVPPPEAPDWCLEQR